MTRDQIDELMRENGVVVAGEAVYALVQLVIEQEREACAKVCEAQQDIFLSPRYAANQPMSSIGERFAAGQCAAAIRARGER